MMHRPKRARLSKGILLLLALLCGSSIFALGYDVFQHNVHAGQLVKYALNDHMSGSNPFTVHSIQAHLQTPPTGNELNPGTKSGKRPGATSTATSTASPTPPAGTTPAPTSTSTAPPPPSNTSTLPPGSSLPSESACADRVSYSSFEPRLDNNTANHSVPSAAQIAALQPWTPTIGMDGKSDSLRRQITGNFTGTTDEIFQWVACKWGIDVNIVRAEAVVESNWHQSQLGDYTTDQSLCPPGTWNGSSCYQSYGVLQIKYTYFKSEWPMARQDTAFNAEFVYGWLRNCYEGWADYLYNVTPAPGYPRYHAGDIWGCVGFWFSGSWYTQGAIDYIAKVQQYYNQKPWLQSGF
jgi:hypothetical protein